MFFLKNTCIERKKTQKNILTFAYNFKNNIFRTGPRSNLKLNLPGDAKTLHCQFIVMNYVDNLSTNAPLKKVNILF